MKQRLILHILVIGLLCCLADASMACDCGSGSYDPKEGLKDKDGRKAVVFAGAVESIRRVEGDNPFRETYDVKFRVSRWWKGNYKRVTVVSTGNSGSCGYDFEAGHNYMVYAYSSFEGRIYTSACSATHPSTLSGDSLVLGPGYPPSNPLPRLLAVISATLALGVLYWRRKNAHMAPLKNHG